TTAGVYSLRPLPGGPVSAPLTWEEVEAGNVTPDQFTIRSLGERLNTLGDVAAEMATFRQPLPHL
ncbi:MAG: bifunctional non-homologous end joining protein LigD, partial [Chloroflexi bacterium]